MGAGAPSLPALRLSAALGAPGYLELEPVRLLALVRREARLGGPAHGRSRPLAVAARQGGAHHLDERFRGHAAARVAREVGVARAAAADAGHAGLAGEIDGRLILLGRVLRPAERLVGSPRAV